jgi:hypothetical protein
MAGGAIAGAGNTLDEQAKRHAAHMEEKNRAVHEASSNRQRVATLMAEVESKLGVLVDKENTETDRYAKDCPKWVARGGCVRNGLFLFCLVG